MSFFIFSIIVETNLTKGVTMGIADVVHDNKVKIQFIKELLEKWSWELDNGYAKQVLQGKLEAYEQANEMLIKE
jgi:hypothetical protein